LQDRKRQMTMADSNQFCTLDQTNYPKWTPVQFLGWWTARDWKGHHTPGGMERLWAYKRGWVSYNRLRIAAAANLQAIPSDLLGCVAFNEVGGDPPAVKHYGVLTERQYVPKSPDPMTTSEGAIKIQLRNALSVIGYKGPPLTHSQQRDLTSCLETDVFNIDVVAKFLRQMILLDYPRANTRALTDEQFIVAGCRYNRGTARKLSDFVSSIAAPKNTPAREWSSYGRAMISHRDEVKRLLSGT
jgi:hypothetical protein